MHSELLSKPSNSLPQKNLSPSLSFPRSTSAVGWGASATDGEFSKKDRRKTGSEQRTFRLGFLWRTLAPSLPIFDILQPLLFGGVDEFQLGELADGGGE